MSIAYRSLEPSHILKNALMSFPSLKKHLTWGIGAESAELLQAQRQQMALEK